MPLKSDNYDEMKMKNKCLYCYEALDTSGDFHVACSRAFFGSPKLPQIEYSLNQMAELAKDIVERSVTVPGVQAKLSMSLIEDTKGKTDARLTVVGALGGRYIFKPPNELFPEMPGNEHVTIRMAEAMIFGRRYLYVGFMCHQTIEKAFKAYFSKLKDIKL